MPLVRRAADASIVTAFLRGETERFSELVRRDQNLVFGSFAARVRRSRSPGTAPRGLTAGMTDLELGVLQIATLDQSPATRVDLLCLSMMGEVGTNGLLCRADDSVQQAILVATVFASPRMVSGVGVQCTAPGLTLG